MADNEPSEEQKPSDISNLQDTFNKQQAKISALKELVRKSGAAHGKSTSSAQEKVKNIAEKLTLLKSKARSRQNLDKSIGSDAEDSSASISTPFSTPVQASHKLRSDTPGSEKIQLLRRQMEENKLKMAERENSKREIEVLVTQLKAKFDSTQESLQHSSELGRSMGDLSALSYTPAKDRMRSATDLTSAPLNLDKERIKFLDNRVRLLEKQLEKEREKGSARDESESVKKVKELSNRILELEECLREAKDVGGGAEIEDLKHDLEEKTKKIKNLEEVNDLLETTRCDLTLKISQLESASVEFEKRIAEFESQKFEVVYKEEVDVAKEIGIEYASQLQSVQEKIAQLEKENDELKKLAQESQVIPVTDDSVKPLEAIIEAQREEIKSQSTKIQQLEDQLAEKTIECSVLNANFSVLEEKLKNTAPKSLFSRSTDEEAQAEIVKLKAQLDEVNKSMIKTKLKAKQLQKQVDTFKKTSDVQAELVRLTEENQELQQRIAELEDDKGQLQLKLVSGETVSDSELGNKLQMLEATCENQTTAIQLLEEQKLETKQELQSLKEQIHEKGESERVRGEMEAIQLEEKVAESLKVIEGLRLESEKLREERDELAKKLHNFAAENAELLDKIGKLSKSSSSAESIEIVERLTQQERLEMEGKEKVDEKDEKESKDKGEGEEELSESLIKLQEESSELMNKIELFTLERREVLDKLEAITKENQSNLERIEELSMEKSALEDELAGIEKEKVSLEAKYETVSKEKDGLVQDLKEFKQISEELARISAGSQLSKPSDSDSLIEKCEKCLAKLHTELENYRKASDKAAKFSASKKVVKEAKNTHQNLSEVLQKIKTAPVPDNADVEKLKEKCVESEEVVESLRHELDEIRAQSEAKTLEITRINAELETFKSMSEDFDKVMNDKEMSYEKQIEHLTRLRKELEQKIETSEKEMQILKDLISEQKQQLIESYTEREAEMSAKIDEMKEKDRAIDMLKGELDELRSSFKATQPSGELQFEIENLKEALVVNKTLAAEQVNELINKQETIDELNAQIMNLYKTMEENANKVIEKDDEIAYLQEILDANKVEIERLTKEADENKQVAEKLLIELHTHKQSLTEMEKLSAVSEEKRKLEQRVADLEKVKDDLEQKNKEQMEKMKKFAANLKKKAAQCVELEKRLKEMESRSEEGEQRDEPRPKREHTLSERSAHDQVALERNELLVKLEHALHERNALSSQVEQLISEISVTRASNEQTLVQLQNAMIEQEALRGKLGEQNAQLEQTLKAKNSLSAQLEFAQNEKNSLIQKLSTLIEETEEKVAKLTTLEADSKAKSVKIEKCKAVIKEKNREIQRLTMEKQALESRQQIEEAPARVVVQAVVESTSVPSTIELEYNELKVQHAKLLEDYEQEKQNFKDTISRLEMLHDGIQAKLQEDMSYIESLELENNKYKEKICKLEECVNSFEERRASMERRANLLDAQLQSKTDEFEKNEDALVYRLNMLSDHDDVIGQRLLESQEEKELLAEKLDKLKQEHSQLVLKHTKLEKEYASLQLDTQNTLETENQSLREQLASMESEINKMHSSYNSKLAKKTEEIDELENDLSEQLQKIESEKRTLSESLERTTDELQELKNEFVGLKENFNSLEQAKNDLEREITWIRLQNENMSQDQFELQELRMQVLHDKTENDNLKHQIETLIQHHDIELNALRLQISELDTLRMQVGQNQTDDQVFIETENKRLKDQLAEKEAMIENYQRQNLQLQMSTLLQSPSGPSDPFAVLSTSSQPDDDVELVTLKAKVERLEREVQSRQEQIGGLQAEVGRLQTLQLAEKEKTDQLQVELDQLRTAQAKADPERYESEMVELRTILINKSEQNEQISVELNGLQTQLQKVISEKEKLEEEVDKLRNTTSNAPPTMPLFSSEQNVPSAFDDIVSGPPSVFDELVTVRHVENVTMSPNLHPATDQSHQLEQLTNERDSLIGQLEQTLSERNKLSIEIQQLLNEKEKSSDVQKALEQALGENQILNQKLQEVNEQIPELQRHSAELQSERNNLSTEIQQILSEKEALTQQMNDIWNERSAFYDQIQQLLSEKEKASDVQKTLNENANRLDEVLIENLSLKEMSAHNEQKIAELQKHTADLQAQLQTLSAAYDSTLQQLEESKKNYEMLVREKEIEKQIESQVMPPSLNMFFNTPSAQASQFEDVIIPQIRDEQSTDLPQPVVEDIIVPKSTYLCQPGEQSSAVLELGTDEWGGDGWGAEEAALEEKHFAQSSGAPSTLLSPTHQMNIQLQDAQDRIAELELERDRLEQQKQELQVKSGKLMKKLKEYKTKIDEFQSSGFRKSSSIESSNDLDLAIQEELKSQIKQLEEKLAEMKKNAEKDVSEKDNLLKRLDVLTAANDRMTEMKERQDSDVQMYQSRIRELNDKLKNLEDWGGEGEERGNPQKEEEEKKKSDEDMREFHEKIAKLTTELEDTKIDRDELQALLEEERSNFLRAEQKLQLLQERIVALEENQSAFNQTSDDVNAENSNLKQKLVDSERALDELKRSLDDSTQKLNETMRKLEETESELVLLKTTVANLTAQNQSLVAEIENLQKSDSKSDQLEEKLQERDAEIVHLKQKIEDLQHEDQTEKLVLEILSKNQEIHMLKMQVKHLEEEKSDLENNLSLQITRDMEQRKTSFVVEPASDEIASQKIKELEETIKEMTAEKAQMEEELQVLNNHVMASLEAEDSSKQIVLELDMKNIEIAELKKSLETARRGGPDQAQWEAIIEERCGEIAESWRQHLEQKEADFKAIEMQLKREIESLRSGVPVEHPLEPALDATKTAADPELTDKMQSVLEAQELEIVTLKEQLAIRSAEYASLAAQYDPYQMKTLTGGSPQQSRRSASTGESTVVPKSELDLALYMLHQRDMRCEELTVELVSLLEERDTLQLKLSNTIRQVEEIKTKTGFKDVTTADAASSADPSGSPTKSQAQPEGPGEEKSVTDDLRQKLSQLHSSQYRKDKNFLEEQQQRLRQMEKIQQDVAKMPSQAVSQLVGTDLSQSTQSPSSVLLNWLWGKPNDSQQQS